MTERKNSMLTYWYKGEEKEVAEEIAEKAMGEFEERFLDEEQRSMGRRKIKWF